MSPDNQSERRAFLINALSGECVTYGELLARLNAVPATALTLCQPASSRDALLQVSAAIAAGFDLVLFDRSLAASEVLALGFHPSQVNQPVLVGQSATVTREGLHKLVTGGSHARLGLFTSGSTGLPKLVWQGVANLARAVRVSPRNEEAVWALAYSPTHVAGIQVYLQALANGCTLVDVFGLDRVSVLAALERHKVTHISATPSFYRLLLPMDRPLAHVRSVTLGGESADAWLLQKLAILFPQARLHNVYASTEAGTLLVADGDVFAISPGLEGKVVLRDGRIHVHHSLLGEFVQTGDLPQEGAKSTKSDEWYDTGDVIEVVKAEPLRFRIVARQRDWVNVGGSKVNPHEVEAVLGEHPDVAQVRVLGRKNSVLGQILCAEVVCRNPAVTEAELRSFAASRLQPHKIPRSIRFVDNIARTRTGKVSRQ